MNLKEVEYALEDLEQLLKWVNKDCSIAGFLNLVASANTIRIALEKEIPKKPKFKTDYNIGVNYHVCPNCEAVVNEYHNYCSGFTPEGIDGCGQRLDWD